MLKWLYAMWRLRRVWAHKTVLFSERLELMNEVRPKLDGGTRIAHPDALMLVTAVDVDRAIAGHGH